MDEFQRTCNTTGVMRLVVCDIFIPHLSFRGQLKMLKIDSQFFKMYVFLLVCGLTYRLAGGGGRL